MSDRRFRVGKTSELTKKRNTIKKTSYYRRKREKTDKKVRGNSGPTPVARGGYGAKAPPLAVRQTLTPRYRRACGSGAGIRVGVFGGTFFIPFVNGSG